MAENRERGPETAGQDIVTDQTYGAAADTPEAGAPESSGAAGGLGGLVSGVVSDLQGLLRGEFRLAQAELKEEATVAAGGAATVAAGGIAGLVGVVFLMHGVAEALGRIMPRWAANTLVGLGLLAGAGSLGASGKEKLSAANLKPARTMETLSETGAWLKGRLGAATGQGQAPGGQ
jgi:hypothetical protein